VSLVAAALEQRGISTVMLSVMPTISAQLTAPRTLVLPFGLGTPVGPPHDAATHLRVVAAALALTGEMAVPVTRVWSDSV
jgi:hypothetical protein